MVELSNNYVQLPQYQTTHKVASKKKDLDNSDFWMSVDNSSNESFDMEMPPSTK
jgi:hypothetical protein